MSHERFYLVLPAFMVLAAACGNSSPPAQTESTDTGTAYPSADAPPASALLPLPPSQPPAPAGWDHGAAAHFRAAGTGQPLCRDPDGGPLRGARPHDACLAYPHRPLRWGVSGTGGFSVFEPNPATDPGLSDPGLDADYGAWPRVSAAPVVVVLRGACPAPCNKDMTINLMYPMIEHLVGKGAIVIFPHYQSHDLDGGDSKLEPGNVVGAIGAALWMLRHPEPPPWWRDPGTFESDRGPTNAEAFFRCAGAPCANGNDHAQPDLTRVGVVGHSRGSQMAALFAAYSHGSRAFGPGLFIDPGHTVDTLSIPRPAWTVVVEPGPAGPPLNQYAALADIPIEVPVVLVTGEHDALAGEAKALAMWDYLVHAAPWNTRRYVRVLSDQRTTPGFEPLPLPTCVDTGQIVVDTAACVTPGFVWVNVPRGIGPGREVREPFAASGLLIADHYFPGNGDALDIYSLWKLTQGLVECTGGYARSCPYALGAGPEAGWMGEWSDFQDVHPLCLPATPYASGYSDCTRDSRVDNPRQGPDG